MNIEVLLILWLVMEEVCPKLRAAYIALFSDNPPTIGWVKRLAVRDTLVEMQLVLEVTLRLNNSGGITVDAFAHFWERKFYDG